MSYGRRPFSARPEAGRGISRDNGMVLSSIGRTLLPRFGP